MIFFAASVMGTSIAELGNLLNINMLAVLKIKFLGNKHGLAWYQESAISRICVLDIWDQVPDIWDRG